MKKIACLLVVILLMGIGQVALASEAQVVVLLHGLARKPSSMTKLAKALRAQGFQVCNVGYPSTEYSIETLTKESVLPAVQQCVRDLSRPIHFVSHSMGGIVVRELRAIAPELHFGRVVMLGPPNRGSEIADKLVSLNLLHFIVPPAGLELGTSPDAVPIALGPVDFEVGIIAGTSTISPMRSLFLLRGDDDGTVAVESAKIEGMRDFLLVPAVHPFLMKNQEVIAQTIHFIETGQFVHSDQRLAHHSSPQRP